jgi:hypothetical protein
VQSLLRSSWLLGIDQATAIDAVIRRLLTHDAVPCMIKQLQLSTT